MYLVPVSKYSEYLVPVACVHNRGVSTCQGSGLEGCPLFRDLD